MGQEKTPCSVKDKEILENKNEESEGSWSGIAPAAFLF